MARRPALDRAPAPTPMHAPGVSARADAPSAARAEPFVWGQVTAARATLVYALLAIAYLAAAFAPTQQLGGSDYTPAGYMMMEFISRAIAAGHLPRWVPDIMGGLPLFANPGSTFHPVRLLLALVLRVRDVLPALFAVHFVVAGTGTYLLLRELRCRPWVAALGGLAYEFTGMLASLLYAGHDGRFIVAASAPLFLACLHRGIRSGRVAPFAAAAATLGSAMLSFQLQSVYYLMLAGAAWALFTLATTWRDARTASDATTRTTWLARRIGLGLGAVAVALALAAVDFLPFVDYVDASPRAASVGRGYDYATSFSMPPVETLGLAVPEQAGILGGYQGTSLFKLHTEYVGALVVALAIVGLLVSIRDRQWRFFAALGAFATTLAWGGYTPLYRLYYTILPGTAKFRAPNISFYVATMSLVVMAGLTLERLATLREGDAVSWAPTRRRVRALLGGIVGVAVLAWVTQSISGPASAAAGAGWLRFGIFALVVAGTLTAWLARRLTTPVAVAVLALGTTADLWMVDRRFLLLVAPPDTLYAADDVVGYLQSRPDVGRVWVFPNPVAGDSGGYLGNKQFGVHSNYLMRFGLQQIGGEHGNQLQRWNEYGGVGQGNQMVDWHNLVRWRSMRRAAGIRYAVARTLTEDGRVVPSGMQPVHEGAARVFRDDDALPRAYLVPAVVVAPGRGADLAAMTRDDWEPRRAAVAESAITGVPTLAPNAAPATGAPAVTPTVTPPLGTATLVVDTPDSVVVHAVAPQPALLVLSDNHYPDWSVTVDGRPAQLHRVNHTFRGVAVGAGAHDVAFAFRPAALYRGLWLSIATAAALAAWSIAWGLRAMAARRHAR